MPRPELRNHGVGWMRAVERLRNGGVPRNPVFLMPATHCMEISAVWVEARKIDGGDDGTLNTQTTVRHTHKSQETLSHRSQLGCHTHTNLSPIPKKELTPLTTKASRRV